MEEDPQDVESGGKIHSVDPNKLPEVSAPPTTSSVGNVSGGVNVTSGETHVGGDVVGRDKIVDQSVHGDVYHVHIGQVDNLTFGRNAQLISQVDKAQPQPAPRRVPERYPFDEPYYGLPEWERDIESILETLGRPRQQLVVMVSGLGGLGKTFLAAEVARRCAGSFQKILWESAKQEMFVEGRIAKIRDAVIAFPELVDSFGQQIEGRDFAHKPESEKMESLKHAFRTRPYLAIVDNLETMDNVEEIVVRLKDLIGGDSRILITSRQVVTTDLFHVTLYGLSESSSIAFLKKDGEARNLQVIQQADENALRQIYLVTQGMPLAMKMIVGQVGLWGLSDALASLRQGQGAIYFFIFLNAWERLSVMAKKVLLYMGRTVGMATRREMEMVLEIQGEPLNQAITELAQLSLLNVSGPLEQRTYEIHQLTRYFVMNDLPAHWKKQGLI